MKNHQTMQSSIIIISLVALVVCTARHIPVQYPYVVSYQYKNSKHACFQKSTSVSYWMQPLEPQCFNPGTRISGVANISAIATRYALEI